MEFLMTYGWALLVVLIVIGVITYGFVDFSNLLPEKCTFSISVNCVDYSVKKDSIAASPGERGWQGDGRKKHNSYV